MSDNFVRDNIIGFFEADVLSYYEKNPHKYELDTDYFEGVLKTTTTYFYKLESSGRLDEYICIRFGYHRKKDGTLCIAVYRPDLKEASEIERGKWTPFVVEKPLLSPKDKRFEMWYDRYIRGSFDVESGPRKRLSGIIEKINACCKTLVGEPLYTAVPDHSVCYPISPNSHAYEDAHKNLYGFLIDLLSKKCLLALADLRDKTIPEAQNMKSKTLLRHVFNEFDKHSKLHTLLSKVSDQRRKSSHGDRPEPIECDAFGDFYRDLEVATEVYEELLRLIESEFSVSSDNELRRHEIMKGLPKLDKDKVIESHFSICKATRMEGKTVEKVWFGMCEDSECLHQSEALYLQFTDGEVLAIDTDLIIPEIGNNASMKQNELEVNFRLTWVDAPSNK